MKIAILGGGGFRVPMVYGALLARAERLGLEEVSLYDVDEERLAQIAPVLEGLEQERGEQLPFLRDAAARRGARGRRLRLLRDPRRPARGPRRRRAGAARTKGVVGQETTGPGGICFALRTVPVMRELAQEVARRAPQAWFVNFTNPAGLVTEAIQDILDGRVVGICDSPAGLFRRVAAALEPRPRRALVRLLRPQPPRLAARRPRRRARPAARAAGRRRAARVVRGGPASSAPSGCARSG